jgi:hypothetical protein
MRKLHNMEFHNLYLSPNFITKMTPFWDTAQYRLGEVYHRFWGDYFVHHQSAFTVEAVRISETSVYLYESTRRYISESCHLCTRSRKILKIRIFLRWSKHKWEIHIKLFIEPWTWETIPMWQPKRNGKEERWGAQEDWSTVGWEQQRPGCELLNYRAMCVCDLRRVSVHINRMLMHSYRIHWCTCSACEL